MSDAPVSTYRLQLGPELTFADVTELIDYLGDLGVTHLYLSPILQARPGSTHGYDVADPTAVSAVLGGEEGLRTLAVVAHAAGLGLVVDLVPNHVGTGFATPLWRALLAEGRHGAADDTFDVDWETPLPGAAGKVVVPVLGDPYGEVLARGELRVVSEEGERRLAYRDHRFPVTGDAEDLHALLERQHYRLVHWRAGHALVNYRRFFSIDDLAGVRVEDKRVFDLTHGKVLELVADGVVDGLRIDHPDGLRDPAGYLRRLAERTGGLWTAVEKIAMPGEPLPDWPAAGTTGYEFANDVLGLFVDPAAEPALTALDTEMGGDPRPYAGQAEAAKREVLAGELAADVRRLARQLWALTAQHLEVRDVDDLDCLAALTDVAVALDVYRTYVDPRTGAHTREDVGRVEAAVARAQRRPNAPPALYPFLARLLTGRAGHLDLVARFQQLTGALTAKGVEDTVFYRYRRLLALNEVGGDPSRFGIDVATFHARNADRPAHGMLTTATHDTKRGEDARLRIAALSELPERWTADVRRWRRGHAHLVTDTAHGPAPDLQTRLLLYQTLVAVWPPDRDRVAAYVVKASREAKQRTSWRDPDADFEAGVERFLDGLLADQTAMAEIGDLAAACARIADISGLAQVLLRCTSPGVPDTYQGTEFTDDSLVDPDNRRRVDFAARRAALASHPKMWVLSRALHARRDHPEPLGYVPLDARGALAGNVVAFARTDANQPVLITVAPRLPGAVVRAGGWGDTAITLPATYTDVLSGRRHGSGELALAHALSDLPVALLLRMPAGQRPQTVHRQVDEQGSDQATAVDPQPAEGDTAQGRHQHPERHR